MVRDSLSSVLQHLHRLVGAGGPDEVSDGDLLGRFAKDRDEAAFELLVWRHGPMVLGLCQRLLQQEQDAEDVFQASFLTLARKAASIGKREALPSWLYKVAYRIACRARGKIALCVNHTTHVGELAAPHAESDVIWRDLRGVLDQEVAGLPEAYRRPIVLCYLEGKSNDEAARLLGCPKGTLSARLARARDRLRRRLTRRGCTLSAAALAAVMAEKAVAGTIAPELVRATVRAALAYLSGKTGLLSAKALALTEGVLRMMWYRKMTMLASLLLALVVADVGVGLMVGQTWAGDDPERQQATQADPPPQNPKGARPDGGQGGVAGADAGAAPRRASRDCERC